jgi:hypothetical protein
VERQRINNQQRNTEQQYLNFLYKTYKDFIFTKFFIVLLSVGSPALNVKTGAMTVNAAIRRVLERYGAVNNSPQVLSIYPGKSAQNLSNNDYF